jgi:sigma-E factor negative regulatory protein RseB
VVEIAVKPLDTHRFGHHFALDEQTGLLLRAKLYGPKNQVLERFQFVDIQVGHDISRDVFEGNHDYYEAGHGNTETAPLVFADERLWRPNWMPGGFGAAQKQANMDMMSFTDGLAVFSIFVEALADEQPLSVQGTASKGATVAYSRAILLNGQPHRVTVVGEIPVATAKRIADNVEAIN